MNKFLLERINTVTASLQRVDINILQCIELYDSLIATIESARDKFDNYEEQAKDIFVLDEVGYEKDNKRRKIRKLRAGESRNNEVALTGRDEFRISFL